MATTAKTLFRGAASTTTTTLLYTVPTATTTIVSSIAVTNTTSTARTFTLTFDDIDLHTATTIGANQTVYIDLKQTLTAAKTIKGGASATSVNFHICGVEIA
jgi:hypothetical protein